MKRIYHAVVEKIDNNCYTAICYDFPKVCATEHTVLEATAELIKGIRYYLCNETTIHPIASSKEDVIARVKRDIVAGTEYRVVPIEINID